MTASGVQRALRKLRVLQHDLDQVAEHARQHMGVTCQRGCHHCCFQLAFVTLEEALALVEALGLPWVQDRTRELLEQVNALSSPKMDRVKWFKDQHPCLLLREGECRAYEARPFACRKLLSIEDPAHCSSAHEETVAYVNLEQVVNHLWDQLARIRKYTEVPERWGPLPWMLLLASLYLREGRAGVERVDPDSGIRGSIQRWGHLIADGSVPWLTKETMPDGAVTIRIDVSKLQEWTPP